MKKTAIFFWSVVAGVVVTFGMSVYTAVNEAPQTVTNPAEIAVPATQ